jgi:signal transduction histidine kinase/DNA-binding response OmpR family regulator
LVSKEGVIVKRLLPKAKGRKRIFTVIFAFLIFGISYSLDCHETGFKYYKNYTYKEYGGQTQNRAILQDKRGLIYVGNQTGLLEFDGASWRKIDVPHSLVNSLAIDDTKTIYVGGTNEFGFLAPDSKGLLKYISLLEHLDVNKRNFSYVWETHCTKQGVYFKTSKFLFRWNPNQKKIDTWELDNKFHLSFTCKGELFIHQESVGLLIMDRYTDSLKMTPGGEIFAEKKIFTIVPYDDNKLLIGTREYGFYLYDGVKATPFPTKVDNLLREKKLYQGIRLSSGDFALATLRGGLVVIDAQGKLKEIFNNAYGLQDNNVEHVFEDFHGNLWLALDQGITKIEHVSKFSIYDDRSKLPGSVLSVTRHNKEIYTGTTRGLFLLTCIHEFRLTAGISSNCRHLLSIDDTLLAATTDGVFQVEGKKNIKQRIIKKQSYFLLQSQKDSKRIWVGTREGLVSLYSAGESKTRKWKYEHQFENIKPQVRTIVEDEEGNLWLGTKTRGVLKIDFPRKDKLNYPLVTRYHTSHGLFDGEVRVFAAAGHVMFTTDRGIFRFDETNKRFLPNSTLGKVFSDGSRGVFRIQEDNYKNIWLHSDSRNFQIIPQPDGSRKTFVINKKPFLRVPDVQVNAIYPDPEGDVIWFASDEGLIRYEPHLEKNYHYDFSTIIRKILVNGDVIFAGCKSSGDSKSPFTIIDYKDRNLRFEFAAPFFEAETKTQYQCLLEGHENDWSAFNWETRRDYNNLDAGLYSFRVRAKNVYGHLSSEADFHFKILLPWYRTWWAFLSYALLFLMLTYLIAKWRRSFKLEQEKQKLEKIVIKRTKEIKEKNQQLQKQAEKLREMNEMKSRFLTNISHEFRTPLTLLLGPLEQMLSEDVKSESERKKKLTLMLRNSQRLLGLINQLLELSKFESGKVKLHACQKNIIPFLRGIVSSFDMVADNNELDLTFQAEAKNITLYFDPEKLENVIFNLLSNALKFTPRGGKITIKVVQQTTKNVRFPSGWLEISVCDTGPGIPREQLLHIFDRFYQSDTTYEYHHKGSGIGLSIVKELVELHHGEIESRSCEGKGTEFIIRIPMGDTHLKCEEISGSSEKPNKQKSLKDIQEIYMKDNENEDATERAQEDLGSKKPDKNIILVVDDSVDFRAYIGGALEPLYTVLEAKDGREGIKKAQKIIPDLIVSDILMPEIGGYEMCRVLKSDIKTSHIPIILLTAKASEDNMLEGLETGADDYITKPFSTKMLCARIKNLIDLRRRLQFKRKKEMAMLPDDISVSSVDEEFYKELQKMYEKNLSNPEFNVEQLGKQLYMSRASLYRKIMALTGEPPLKSIRSYRLKRASQLLKANFGNVTEVAVKVGFSNIAHFSHCFKEEFNQLPSTFQDPKAKL